ncbi:pyridoxal phosphate-dependent aminotransferase [Sporomusa sp.]|uniref:pyridoxal phosphate-dependent aminotransferase n=1 Tax=Sporomusa sp. TaxID=2078658 RepID=UPI002BC7EE7E|nr:pyridoxal phosphate-dependent aminotransferase [Sporomusa sp.]HWR07168.1 pyridoxal phosphate-dependent aminotransferase [Sporomusa sp.]
MKLAKRLSNLGTENAFEVLSEVHRLKAAGRDIISFAIGEPDFNTSDNIKQAGIQAIRGNFTHYSPSAGILPLREAIAGYISATRNIRAYPDEVVVTPGGKPIIYYVLHALIDPGDEVIYPNPGFPIYESVIRFTGGVPVPAPILEEKDFSLDTAGLEKLITPRTKLIILNSPHNPTGGMLTAKDLTTIAELACRHNLWVLSDEIYSRITYDDTFASISSLPGMQQRTIILDGFSKTYAMTGWRLGYGVMPQELAIQIARLITNCESCTNTFVQYAGLEALAGPQNFVDSMISEFRARRDLIVAGLNSIAGVSCKIPKGAFYVFPNITEACSRLGLSNSKALQQHLLYNGDVAVLPRTAFGAQNAGEKQEYLRLSYATNREIIIKGLERIEKALRTPK